VVEGRKKLAQIRVSRFTYFRMLSFFHAPLQYIDCGHLVTERRVYQKQTKKSMIKKIEACEVGAKHELTTRYKSYSIRRDGELGRSQ